MKRPKIAGDLYVAEEKMTKLLLLKSLQEERLKLQQLLAAKHQTMTGEPGSKAALMKKHISNIAFFELYL